MKILNRMSKDLPDPLESRRLCVAKLIRIFYATGLACILGYFVYKFGQPLVFLEGTGIVSAPSYNISVPYISHIEHMNVIPGVEVTRGDEIAIVASPEINRDIANLLSEISRIADQLTNLKIKYDTAEGSLNAAANRSDVAIKSLDRTKKFPKGLLTVFEHEQLTREVSQAIESLEQFKAAQTIAKAEISDLIARKKEMELQLSKIRSDFNDGVIYASISGITSSKISHIGDTVVAGATIAEILDKKRIYIDWYIPNFRLYDPKVNDPVFIIFGSTYLRGYISEILPISNVIEGRRQSILKEPESGQIARVNFNDKKLNLPFGSNVSVRMNYIGLVDSFLSGIISFGIRK